MVLIPFQDFIIIFLPQRGKFDLSSPCTRSIENGEHADMTFISLRKTSTIVACWFFLGAAMLATDAMAAAPDVLWARFRQGFVQPDGRVVDPGQGGISHSEGQGAAMLLAVHHGDRASFELIWQWTKANLQVRGDNLLAWRWTPEAGITDKNNASDGDLLVAWSLLRAFNRWHAPAHLQESRNIARDIREKLLRKTPQGLILLPGAEGFEKPEGITVNLSYWVFPALDEMSQADPSPEWEALSRTGMDILRYAGFGRWGLPPDWLLLGETTAPAAGPSGRFGYAAVRIPLYLLWSRRESPALLKPYREFWGYFKGASFLPAWTDLRDDSVDSRDASAGIHRLAQWVLDHPHPPAVPRYRLDEKQGYYSAVLFLLTEMAMSERRLRRR